MSDWKLLNTSTPSGASSVTFTDLTGYKIFKFVGIDLFPSVATQELKFQVNGSGGFTAAVYVAGSNFGDPLTGRVTGCSLGVQGVTGSSTVFNTPSVTAGNFLFLDVFSNGSGASAAQAFLTFESR